MSVQGDSFLGKDCLHSQSPLVEALFPLLFCWICKAACTVMHSTVVIS